jgi:hypothetical protein
VKINVLTGVLPASPDVRVGNVYPKRGGRVGKGTHFLLMAMSPCHPIYGVTCLFFNIDNDGNPVGVTQYGLHYVETMEPVAFVDGLEDLDLTMRPI